MWAPGFGATSVLLLFTVQTNTVVLFDVGLLPAKLTHLET